MHTYCHAVHMTVGVPGRDITLLCSCRFASWEDKLSRSFTAYDTPAKKSGESDETASKYSPFLDVATRRVLINIIFIANIE